MLNDSPFIVALRDARAPRPGSAVRAAPHAEGDGGPASRGSRGQAVLTVPAFTWRPHEHWAILGGNGAGKSTFLALVRGDIAPLQDADDPLRPHRFYRNNGETLVAPGVVKQRIGLVSPELQERYRRLEVRQSVRRVAASGLDGTPLLYRTPSAVEWARVDALLARMEVASFADKPLAACSQGQLRRALVVRAVLALQRHGETAGMAQGGEPAMLLLDEVTQGLDAVSREALLAMLATLAADPAGPRLMIASHRPTEIAALAAHSAMEEDDAVLMACLLEQGRPVFLGPYAALPQQASADRARDFPLPSVRSHATASPGGRIHRGEGALIDVRDATVLVDGVTLLNKVTWRAEAQSSDGTAAHWAVLGANGAGKSTLLRLLLGEWAAAPESVVAMPAVDSAYSAWDAERARVAEDANRPGRWRRLTRVGFVSAELQARVDGDVATRALAASGFFGGLALFDAPTPAMWRLVDAWLEYFGLTTLADRPFGALSTGQARRALLARAMAPDPTALLLDEPASGLDAAFRVTFNEAVADAAARGSRLVYVTHYAEEFPSFMTHALVLDKGHVVFAGPLEALANSGLPQAAALRSHEGASS